MRGAYTDPTHFAHYSKSAKQYKADGYPDCDKQMIPIIDALNTHPELAVVFCCESHPYSRKEYNSSQLYITAAVAGIDGLTHLVNVFEHASKLIETELGQSFMTLELGNLFYDDCTTWRNWTIQAFTGRKTKKIHLSALLQASTEQPITHRIAA